MAKNNNEKSFPGYQAIQLSKYLPVIKEGLIYGYALIQKYVDQIKDLIKSENLVCRQIIRPTLYYTWVIHKLFHPQNKNIGIYLEKSLCNLESEIAEYEKLYLQYGNIPVFYHHIHERHLYGFDNKVIFKNYFEKTAYEWVESKLNKVGSVDFQKKRLLELTSCLK